MNPTPATPPLDAAAVADGLAAARVLDTARVADLLGQYYTAVGATDGPGFADYLARHGHLTPYQAGLAAAGDADRLTVGPFVLLDPLGESGLGLLYRAARRSDGRRFAVRVMPVRSLWKSREAKRTVARLAELPPHAALVPLAEVDTADGWHYLAWPYQDGEPLHRSVVRSPLNGDTAARLFADLADGLAVCHAAGLTHGLLKPSGVLLGTDRRAKFVDLGLGALLAENGDGESMFDTISASNAALARMDYTPPEVVHDPTVRTPAADAYALGAVMYFAVAGVPPFPDGSVVDKMQAHLGQTPLPVRMRNPRVSPAVARVIEQLLAKAPAERPTADAVRDELRALADEAPDVVPLSVTASALRDARELADAFQIRKRSLGVTDTEGAIDFDLPVPADDPTPLPARPEPPARPAPPVPPGLLRPSPMVSAAPKAGDSRVAIPRTIVLPAVAGPGGSEVRPAKPNGTPDPPVPAELPRPVGWQQPDGGAIAGVPVRPAVVVPPPPRRGGLMKSLAFWKATADEVQVSVFGPPDIAPGQRVKFVTYVHLPDVSDNVITLCRALHKGTELLGVGYLDEPLTRGQPLTLCLTLSSAGVAKSQVTLNWTGQPQSKTFDVFVPWESPPGLTTGTLAATGDAPLATVGVQFVVLPRGR